MKKKKKKSFSIQIQKQKKIKINVSATVKQEELPPAWEIARLFVSLSLQLIGWGPPTLQRAMCFTQSTDFVILIQKHLTDSPTVFN